MYESERQAEREAEMEGAEMAAGMMPPMAQVGEVVHYVSYGTPGGEFSSECRAAIIAGIPHIYPTHNDVDLVVLNPTGLFFNRCPYDENRKGGTWHWMDQH